MHTDENSSQGGGRERTLVGYAPASDPRGLASASTMAEAARADGAANVASPVDVDALAASDVEAKVPGDNGHRDGDGEADNDDEAAPSGVSFPAGDRRNPLSRRQPINRGRHLSKQFFEEGERQQETGWENSPLAASTEAADPAIMFSSFDQVPRRRGPLVAAAVVGGVGLALLAAWGLGRQPGGARNQTDVWSALGQPGAGWKPAAVVPTDKPATVTPAGPAASGSPVAATALLATAPAAEVPSKVAPSVAVVAAAQPRTDLQAKAPTRAPSIKAAFTTAPKPAPTAPHATARQPAPRRSAIGSRRNNARVQHVRPAPVSRARTVSTVAPKASAPSPRQQADDERPRTAGDANAGSASPAGDQTGDTTSAAAPPHATVPVLRAAPSLATPAVEATPVVEAIPLEAPAVEARSPTASPEAAGAAAHP